MRARFILGRMVSRRAATGRPGRAACPARVRRVRRRSAVALMEVLKEYSAANELRLEARPGHSFGGLKDGPAGIDMVSDQIRISSDTI